jgi:hypothetical protein
MAWKRGMEPIKQAALEGMRRDVWHMDGTLTEDSYTFQAAMVLFASELVGPILTASQLSWSILQVWFR